MGTQAVSGQAGSSHDSPDLGRFMMCRKGSPEPGWDTVLSGCSNGSTTLWHSTAVQKQLQGCTALCRTQNQHQIICSAGKTFTEENKAEEYTRDASGEIRSSL